MTEAQSALQRVIEAAPLAIALIDARSLRVVQVNDVGARGRGDERRGAWSAGRRKRSSPPSTPPPRARRPGARARCDAA